MVDVDGKLELLGAQLVYTEPIVGSFISDVFTTLWHEEDDENSLSYMDKVRERVFQAIQECLNEEKAETLRGIFDETKNACEEYINIPAEEEERKERCLVLDEFFNQIKSNFMDLSYESVVYFVQFAVLHISVKTDMVVLFRSHHSALDEKHKQHLKDLINEYSLYAHKMSIKLVEFRLSQIDTVCTCRLNPTNPLVVKVIE